MEKTRLRSIQLFRLNICHDIRIHIILLLRKYYNNIIHVRTRYAYNDNNIIIMFWRVHNNDRKCIVTTYQTGRFTKNAHYNGTWVIIANYIYYVLID